MFLPIGLLFKFEPVTLWWLSFLFSFHQLFLHANINLSFGKLDYVIMSPALHRVHHSQLKEHFGKNLAATWPIFDIVFGTFVPAPKVAPPTGIPNIAKMNLIEEHIHPFKDWAKQFSRVTRRTSPSTIPHKHYL
jgi:sterol desaturase/sphingolipid hydroxylase (fatty acid hydroxylase superfamily)